MTIHTKIIRHDPDSTPLHENQQTRYQYVMVKKQLKLLFRRTGNLPLWMVGTPGRY